MTTSPKNQKKTKKQNNLENIVKDLYSIMKSKKLLELDWQEDQIKVSLKRKGALNQTVVPVFTETKEQDKPKDHIYSPMNAVFYKSTSPSSEPFVNENDIIEHGTTVCILEAMKLLNEIRVERKCKIIKVLVKNAESVKINQPLFEVENL